MSEIKSRWRRKEDFIAHFQMCTKLPRPTERDEVFWDVAEDLHKYLCRLDAGNLQAFLAANWTIVDLVDLYADHAGGLRFIKPEQETP